MPLYAPGTQKGHDVSDTGIDANSSTTSTAIDTKNNTHMGVYVVGETGAHANHIVTVQVSPDAGTTWFDAPHTITGLGFIHEEICICDQMRTKVTTNEGAASRITVHIILK